MIKAVLLDIDNTILDFDKCANASLKKVCDDLALPYENWFFATFTKINDNLWKQVEDKIITKEELHRIRFSIVFDAWGVKGDGIDFEKRFKIALKESAEKVYGGMALVKYLSKKYLLAVASNSNYPQQIKRLTLAGYTPYIDKFFFSADIGAEKPSKEFFDACINGLEGISRDQIIIIGDSINADILGGINANIKTCWFNFRKITPPKDLTADYVVNSLSQIKKFL